MADQSQDTEKSMNEIDKKLELLSNRIELKLIKELDEQLQKRIDRNVKILGWAIAIVAGLVALIGIKTIGELHQIAEDTAKNEVINKLSIDDPDSEFRRDLDKVIARGLIDSYTLSIAKNKDSFNSVTLPENDMRRIMSLVSDPNSNIRDFTEGLDVLLYMGDSTPNSPVNQFIEKIAYGVDSKYSWINGQQDKKAALLKSYSGNKLIKFAEESLNSTSNSSKEVVIAAMHYLQKQDIYNGLLFEKLAIDSDPEIAAKAIETIALIQPNSKVIENLVEKAKKSGNFEDWVTVVQTAITLGQNRRLNLFKPDPLAKERILISARMIASAIDNGISFSLANNHWSTLGGAPSLYVVKDSISRQVISTKILSASFSSVIENLLLQSVKNSKFNKVLGAFCFQYNNSCVGSIRVTLKTSSEILLTDGKKLVKSDSIKEIHLQPYISADNKKIIQVTWLDESDQNELGIFKNFTNPDQINFKLVIKHEIADTRIYTSTDFLRSQLFP